MASALGGDGDRDGLVVFRQLAVVNFAQLLHNMEDGMICRADEWSKNCVHARLPKGFIWLLCKLALNSPLTTDEELKSGNLIKDFAMMQQA